MELQDIVRRLRMKQSIKAIKRETGKHRRVIRRVLQLAQQEGWLEAERELPSERQLHEVYHEHRGGEDGGHHPLDARRDQIAGWRREGYSFLVIHELLQQRGVEYSETTVRRYIHRHFPSPVRPVMRRETKPGEVMEVDFGHLGITWDVATRSRRRTWVFSGRLRHCRRAYREVVFDQKQQTLLDGVMAPMRDGCAPSQARCSAGSGACDQKGPAGYREVGCRPVSYYHGAGKRMRTLRCARMPVARNRRSRGCSAPRCNGPI